MCNMFEFESNNCINYVSVNLSSNEMQTHLSLLALFCVNLHTVYVAAPFVYRCICDLIRLIELENINYNHLCMLSHN